MITGTWHPQTVYTSVASAAAYSATEIMAVGMLDTTRRITIGQLQFEVELMNASVNGSGLTVVVMVFPQKISVPTMAANQAGVSSWLSQMQEYVWFWEKLTRVTDNGTDQSWEATVRPKTMRTVPTGGSLVAYLINTTALSGTAYAFVRVEFVEAPSQGG